MIFTMSDQVIRITNRLSIPESELEFTASRSSGPGGQNVNKVSSRVTLWFDLAHCRRLTDEERSLLLSRLGGRVNREGLLWVTSQESRSQAANREIVIRRFAELLREALRTPSVRKATSVSRAAKLRRLNEKKHRGHLKKERSRRLTTDL